MDGQPGYFKFVDSAGGFRVEAAATADVLFCSGF
jgi:hypothetical protein